MAKLMSTEANEVCGPSVDIYRFVDIQKPDAFLSTQAMKALTIQEVFPLSEKDARALFGAIRWSAADGKPYCHACGCTDVYEGHTRALWTCKNCQKQFSITSGTIFSAKKAGFKTLLLAAIALLNNREARNQSEAGRVAGFGQKSAHSLSVKLRRLSLTTAINHVKLESHKFSLEHPRYNGGAWLSTRTWWTDPEKAALKSFSDAKAPLDKVADALGRDPKSIAWFARDLVGPSIMPSEWKALIAPKKKPKLLAEVRLAYPYIRKARPSDADLLKVNDLVPKHLAEWIRADVCQSIMLALYDGSVELAELVANKAKVTEFIKKFYAEQMPWQETNLEGRGGDDRDNYDIAASRSYEDDGGESAERRRMFGSSLFNRWTPATQIETVHFNEVKRAVSLMPIRQRKVIELMLEGNSSVDVGLKLRITSSAAEKRLREAHRLLYQNGLIEMQSDAAVRR